MPQILPGLYASTTNRVPGPASTYTAAIAALCTPVSREQRRSSFQYLPRAAVTTACRSTPRDFSPIRAQPAAREAPTARSTRGAAGRLHITTATARQYPAQTRSQLRQEGQDLPLLPAR